MTPPAEAKRPSVSIVEDNAEIRENLTLLLRESGAVRFLSSYASAEQALDGIPREQPDVVLMDINLPKISGIDCVRRLKDSHPEIHFLMLTVYDDSENIFQSLVAGASGYLIKRAAPDQLLPAILEVHRGGAPMSSAIARKVVQHFRKPPPVSDLEKLTAREEEVLQMLAQGSLYKEIADRLAITIDTVSKHIQGIYKKLHVRTRTEATLKYLRR